jgi:hypothetical protein
VWSSAISASCGCKSRCAGLLAPTTALLPLVALTLILLVLDLLPSGPVVRLLVIRLTRLLPPKRLLLLGREGLRLRAGHKVSDADQPDRHDSSATRVGTGRRRVACTMDWSARATRSSSTAIGATALHPAPTGSSGCTRGSAGRTPSSASSPPLSWRRSGARSRSPSPAPWAPGCCPWRGSRASRTRCCGQSSMSVRWAVRVVCPTPAQGAAFG